MWMRVRGDSISCVFKLIWAFIEVGDGRVVITVVHPCDRRPIRRVVLARVGLGELAIPCAALY